MPSPNYSLFQAYELHKDHFLILMKLELKSIVDDFNSDMV